MDWKDKYTDEELEVIGQTWKELPPASCTGKCKLKDLHLFLYCEGCTWDDIGTDNTNHN